MPLGEAAKKVPGGKLVRVKIDFEGELLKSVQITGDFFMHPEEGLEILEKSLQEIRFDEIEKKVDEVLNAHDLMLVGVSAADLSEVINSART